MRHYVAPVTGGIADGDEHRDVSTASFSERLVGPWPPVDGVIGVLAQVGARLVWSRLGRARLHPTVGLCSLPVPIDRARRQAWLSAVAKYYVKEAATSSDVFVSERLRS